MKEATAMAAAAAAVTAVSSMTRPSVTKMVVDTNSWSSLHSDKLLRQSELPVGIAGRGPHSSVFNPICRNWAYL